MQVHCRRFVARVKSKKTNKSYSAISRNKAAAAINCFVQVIGDMSTLKWKKHTELIQIDVVERDEFTPNWELLRCGMYPNKIGEPTMAIISPAGTKISPEGSVLVSLPKMGDTEQTLEFLVKNFTANQPYFNEGDAENEPS
jgi:hypothetical protein